MTALSPERRALLERLVRARGHAVPHAAALAPRSDAGPFRASYNQERLWRFAQLPGAAPVCHVTSAIRMRGALDRAGLVATLDALVARHAALRTAVYLSDGALVQAVRPARGFALTCRDAAPAEIAGELADDLATPFDLAEGAAIRGRLLRFADDDHALILTMHRITSDGWSRGVLGRDIAALYGGAALPPLPVQYADYAAWQRRTLDDGAMARGLAYWTRQLAGAPRLALPPDRPPSPAVAGRRSLVGGALAAELDRETTARLRALARGHGVTLFMALYAAWAIALAAATGQRDLVIGTPVANRPHTALEDLIGCFVNLVPLRIQLDDDPTLAQLLRRVRDVVLGAEAHHAVPFLEVARAVAPDTLDDSPVFQAMLNLVNVPRRATALPGLTLAPIAVPGGHAEHDVSLYFVERDDALRGELAYAEGYDRATAARWMAAFEAIARTLDHDPDRKISKIGNWQ